ncbi:MAG: SUMF1/EgtB/PvdO family nonheme iron enzyme, partial [Leptospiraceae bacterium]|nr:SUMF1/EgtB/PvdO family nonheme iron enzyme [Leptospiraceae bacterium]
ICILLLISVESFTETNPKKSKKDMDKIILWQGELNAIYKNKGKIILFIPSNPTYVGRDFKEIKEKILKIKKFPIRQKITNKKIGIFDVLYVEPNRTIKKDKKINHEVTVWGKIKLRNKSYKKLVSNDFYISLVRYEDSYVDPSETNYFKDNPTPAEKEIIHPKDKKEMVLIPSGEFIHGQGYAGDLDNYNPAFRRPDFDTLSDLPDFYIDKYEVTNLEYNTYLRETGAKPPAYWPEGNIPEGKEDHPVISLSYREAESYATWAGKRLPTELEWEKAARGPGYKKTLNRDETYTFELVTRKYPFGNKYDSKLCNCSDNGANDTLSVYDLPSKGASYYGVIGMCGNASEWTSSWYEPYKGHHFESPVAGKVVKVVRGGSFMDSRKNCTVYYRSYGGLPNLRSDYRAGIRLVIDKLD